MVKLTVFQTNQTINLLAGILMVISALFIITTGFDSERIMPAIGLSETIAVYLPGKAGDTSLEVQE
ncbi:MAG: hypothetical protein ABI167_05430 [Nitrosospira sp.]